MTTEADERCETCRYSRARKEGGTAQGGEYVIITCHRRAPLVTGGMMSNVSTEWPTVEWTDWCGEFEPSEAERARRAKALEDDPCPF